MGTWGLSVEFLFWILALIFFLFIFCLEGEGLFFISFFYWSFLGLGLRLNVFFSIFLFLLLIVFFSIICYSSYYLDSVLWFRLFVLLMMFFVSSIFLLLFSNSFFLLLLGWDLLGLSSFFLVSFYNNWDSFSGALNTVLANRLGDVCLFFSFVGGIVFRGRFFFLSFSSISLFLLGAGFSKRAQFPFMRWLPKAMAAPTPVRALVHRSTLVTAGGILFFKFFLFFSSFFVSLIFFFSLFTLFMSSASALYEEDVKKVVALRTLSQIGFSIFSLRVGLPFLSFLHLVSHGFFKRLLFLQVGYLIHLMLSQQDGRRFSGSGSHIFIRLQMKVSLLRLCGLFYTNGTVTKDLVLEGVFFNSLSFLLSIFFFLSVFLTFLYSFRLWNMFFKEGGPVFILSQGRRVLKWVCLGQFCCSFGGIWWLNRRVLLTPAFFLSLDGLFPIFFLFLFFLVVVFEKRGFFFPFSFSFFVADFFPLWRKSLGFRVSGFESFFYSLNVIGIKSITFVSNWVNSLIRIGSFPFLFFLLFCFLFW